MGARTLFNGDTYLFYLHTIPFFNKYKLGVKLELYRGPTRNTHKVTIQANLTTYILYCNRGIASASVRHIISLASPLSILMSRVGPSDDHQSGYIFIIRQGETPGLVYHH